MPYTPPTEGDPGRHAYLHNANWTAKPHVQAMNVDPRVCPGCLFPHAMRKHEHVEDERCQVWKTNQAAALIEAGQESGGKADGVTIRRIAEGAGFNLNRVTLDDLNEAIDKGEL
jgi:hypothetical protein